MMKALEAKPKHRQDNVKFETELLHFYCFLNTHSPKVVKIVSANTNVGFSQQ